MGNEFGIGQIGMVWSIVPTETPNVEWNGLDWMELKLNVQAIVKSNGKRKTSNQRQSCGDTHMKAKITQLRYI